MVSGPRPARFGPVQYAANGASLCSEPAIVAVWETESMKRFAHGLLAVAGMLVSATALAQGTPSGFTTDQVRTALRALLPAGVLVDEVTLDGERATAKGSAPSNQLVSQFLRRIDDAAEFETPELLTMSVDGARMAYAIDVTVRCPADRAATGPGLCGGTPSKPKSVYKCRIDGTITFQATACPPGKDA